MTFVIAIELAIMVMGSQAIAYAMGSWPAPFGIELRVDAFSALVLLVVTGASTFALVAGETASIARSRRSANRISMPRGCWP